MKKRKKGASKTGPKRPKTGPKRPKTGAKRGKTAPKRATTRPKRATTRPKRATERRQQADGETTRPETPELEGRTPLPEEITGKASGTDEGLEQLFDSDDDEHLADGFRGGSEDEPSR